MKHRVVALIEKNTDQFDIEFNDNHNILWCIYRHWEKPCFTHKVIGDILEIQSQINFCLKDPKCLIKPKYLIWASSLSGTFNLGGDLELFADLVRSGERGKLQSYAYQCVRTVYNNFTNLDLPLLNITLVQGSALGGGFEAALTSDIIIAERQSKFGLPEIKFNLFPGMGAYSLLSRRLGSLQTKKMILSGRLYSAEEMYQLGIGDVLADAGKGKATVSKFIQQNEHRYRALVALSEIKKCCQPVSYEELIDVTNLWVDTAMTLEEADLLHMERLANAQRRHRQKATAGK